MDFRREWAPAIKTSLGDVWHLMAYGGLYAACDSRLSVCAGDCRTAPTAEGPSDVYVCKRCQKIAEHWNAAKAERV